MFDERRVMGMTIDEAIKHYEDIAESCEFEAGHCDETDGYECHEMHELGKCAEEHRQLAEWLRELVVYRKLRICGNCRHYVGGTTHFGECHVTPDIEPWVVSVNQTACDTFFDYKDFRNEAEQNDN